jgi:hypothetical protein
MRYSREPDGWEVSAWCTKLAARTVKPQIAIGKCATSCANVPRLRPKPRNQICRTDQQARSTSRAIKWNPANDQALRGNEPRCPNEPRSIAADLPSVGVSSLECLQPNCLSRPQLRAIVSGRALPSSAQKNRARAKREVWFALPFGRGKPTQVRGVRRPSTPITRFNVGDYSPLAGDLCGVGIVVLGRPKKNSPKEVCTLPQGVSIAAC